MKERKILIIEDDNDIVDLLRFNLEREGYRVFTASTGEAGLTIAQEEKPSLLILDLGLPGIQGLELCRLMKQKPATSSISIVILTAKGLESDVVAGLELGADDYIVKPFRIRELIARVRAVLRRAQSGGGSSAAEDQITAGRLTIDSLRHEVLLDGKRLNLTLAEFKLLKLLVSQIGRVFTRDQLLNAITNGETFIIDRNVDVHIRSIRKKIGSEREKVRTVRGIGYKFVEVVE